MHTNLGKCIIQGESSISPVSTPLEAEAVKLHYENVQFVGDCQVLYVPMHELVGIQKRSWCPSNIAGEVQDISNRCLSKNSYCFKYVPRSLLQEVDTRAKYARSCSKNYVVRYNLS